MKKLEGKSFIVNDERSEFNGQIITIEYVDPAYVFYVTEDGTQLETSIAHAIYRIKQGIWQEVN